VGFGDCSPPAEVKSRHRLRGERPLCTLEKIGVKPLVL
jgi:hypothetical protein